MASLKEIKGRINSIRNTQKITSAMRMVATAKLRRTQGRAAQVTAYVHELTTILGNLQAMLQSKEILPQTSERPLKHVTLIAISSNSGLCGVFNTNLFKTLKTRIQEYRNRGAEVSVIPIGKKVARELSKLGMDYLSDLIESGEKYASNPTPETQAPLNDLLKSLNEKYESGLLDHVEIVAPHFKSMGTQTVETYQIVPFQVEVDKQEDENLADYIVEPSPIELYLHTIPLLQRTRFLEILLDAATAEHAARMLAMQTADDNASDLLQELTLLYNKTRQQSITNELIDIMSGKG